jgi:hypothetical protein
MFLVILLAFGGHPSVAIAIFTRPLFAIEINDKVLTPTSETANGIFNTCIVTPSCCRSSPPLIGPKIHHTVLVYVNISVASVSVDDESTFTRIVSPAANAVSHPVSVSDSFSSSAESVGLSAAVMVSATVGG